MIPVISKIEEAFRIFAFNKADANEFRKFQSLGGPKRDIIFTYEPLQEFMDLANN